MNPIFVWLASKRYFISLSHRYISCTFFVRQMSQIFATVFEYMFDGRRTKIEKLNGEVGMPGLGDKRVCYVKC